MKSSHFDLYYLYSNTKGIKEGKIEGLREGKIVGKIETLYEELHMTVVEIAEKLAISEEEVQRIVDAL